MGTSKWGTAGQLMDAVREVGKELIAAKPSNLAVGNMVRSDAALSSSKLSDVLASLQQEQVLKFP